MEIVSIRENPHYKDQAINYFQEKWASEDSMKVYEDCINHAITSERSLPQWYLMIENENIIGCAGLITNDFISRMDLYPWMCSLYIEPEYRGHAYGLDLVSHVTNHAKALGFDALYLCTDHEGYYEKKGFHHIGRGYHPWGETSEIFERKLGDK